MVDPKENELEEHPDKEFEWMVISDVQKREQRDEWKKKVSGKWRDSHVHLNTAQVHLLSVSFNLNSHILFWFKDKF